MAEVIRRPNDPRRSYQTNIENTWLQNAHSVRMAQIRTYDFQMNGPDAVASAKATCQQNSSLNVKCNISSLAGDVTFNLGALFNFL